jgi:hypothetical protein
MVISENLNISEPLSKTALNAAPMQNENSPKRTPHARTKPAMRAAAERAFFNNKLYITLSRKPYVPILQRKSAAKFVVPCKI